ncbi:GNAT family N-acetyltransferase [Domibacillus robiginosus]|uniref:GNAT family N-acetyltransferase n=1 Tax=Domibacillus robiginosus TaxID=1071054 RepID=UPI000A6C71A8
MVTDFSYCAYISDLAVKKDYQGRGIDPVLWEKVKKELSDEVTFVLLSASGAMDFYSKQGYDQADNAFRIMRKK